MSADAVSKDDLEREVVGDCAKELCESESLDEEVVGIPCDFREAFLRIIPGELFVCTGEAIDTLAFASDGDCAGERTELVVDDVLSTDMLGFIEDNVVDIGLKETVEGATGDVVFTIVAPLLVDTKVTGTDAGILTLAETLDFGVNAAFAAATKLVTNVEVGFETDTDCGGFVDIGFKSACNAVCDALFDLGDAEVRAGNTGLLATVFAVCAALVDFADEILEGVFCDVTDAGRDLIGVIPVAVEGTVALVTAVGGAFVPAVEHTFVLALSKALVVAA